MMNKKYKTILADPPWEQPLTGSYKRKKNRAKSLPYPTMSLKEIKDLPVNELADEGCHLWLWVTNAFLKEGFEVMEVWGFKYLCPITWVKPSGLGNYFIHRTQHILFGYKDKCQFEKARYRPNVFEAKPLKHSEKPEESYQLIESISKPPYLELFARKKRHTFTTTWDIWGNEVKSDIILTNK